MRTRKPTTILVPTDFSPCARAAMKVAIGLGERFGARVEAVHAWEPPSYVVPDVPLVMPHEPKLTLRKYIEREARSALDRFLDETGAAAAGIGGRLVPGHPADAVLDLARDEGFDLIVLGVTPRRGIPHLHVGGVAHKVLRRAPCPVMTVRCPAEGAGDR